MAPARVQLPNDAARKRTIRLQRDCHTACLLSEVKWCPRSPSPSSDDSAHAASGPRYQQGKSNSRTRPASLMDEWPIRMLLGWYRSNQHRPVPPVPRHSAQLPASIDSTPDDCADILSVFPSERHIKNLPVARSFRGRYASDIPAPSPPLLRMLVAAHQFARAIHRERGHRSPTARTEETD
ncbi:hypothetical protein D9M72_531070 [compost metagenome]